MVNVVGVSATRAGISLIPLSLGVVAGSMLAGQMVSRFGHYRRWMLGGGLVVLTGLSLLATMPADISYGRVLAYVLLTGLGLGPGMPLYTLAVQNAVDMRQIGQATSASQFFRQIGGAIAVALLGAVLSFHLADHLPPAGRPLAARPAPIALEGAEPLAADLSPAAREAFANAIRHVYGWTMLLVAAGWLATLLIPELPLRKSNASDTPVPAE
jgi:MFS family permease